MTGAGAPETRSRRRGKALENAIHEAVLTEIIEKGFGGLTFEGVAERCGTGKASLYRRWSRREDMVLACLFHTLPPDDFVPADTGALRTDLLQALRRMNAAMADQAGLATARLIGEHRRHPELIEAVRDRLLAPRLAMLEEICRREATRRNLVMTKFPDVARTAGPSLIVWRHLLDGAPVGVRELDEIVDLVVLPIVESLFARLPEAVAPSVPENPQMPETSTVPPGAS